MSAYPPWLKNIIKAGPGCVVFLGFSLGFGTVLHDTLFHTNERIEKFHFRSCKFDRMTRKRYFNNKEMISLEFIGNKRLNLILIIKEFLKQSHY